MAIQAAVGVAAKEVAKKAAKEVAKKAAKEAAKKTIQKKAQITEVSPLSADFLLMLGLAVLFDALDIIISIIEHIFTATIPVVSGFLDFIAAVIIGRWLKSKGVTPTKGVSGKTESYSGAAGGTKSYLKQLIISWIAEQIPILGALTPTWTLNVISALENKNSYYIVFATLFLTLPIALMVLIPMLFPKMPSAGTGHSVLYREDCNEQEMIEDINTYFEKGRGGDFKKSPYVSQCEKTSDNSEGSCAKYFVEYGKKWGIHPGYLVGLSVAETSLCTDPEAKGCCPEADDCNGEKCYNSWGRKGPSSNNRYDPPINFKGACGGWTQYENWQEGIDYHADYLEYDYTDPTTGRGLTTVESIAPIYCGPHCDQVYISRIIENANQATERCPLETVGTAGGPVAQEVVRLAQSQLGKRYFWSGPGCKPYSNYPPNTPKNFDCSSLTGWVYYWATKNVTGKALDIGQNDDHQRNNHCELLDPGQEEPGDLVFWPKNSGYKEHVGIIIEKGSKFIHASGNKGCPPPNEPPHPDPEKCRVKWGDLTKYNKGNYKPCRVKGIAK